MTIEPKISKYIDTAIERQHKIFSKDFNTCMEENKHHMGALKEAFQHEVQILAELISERPTRDEVRTIAREEIDESLRPVNAKLDFLNEERKQMLEVLSEIKA